MSGNIQFDTLDSIAVQTILEDRGVEPVVTDFRGVFNEDGLELQGYTIECEDEIDVCDILNLSYDEPVVCERRDVENCITLEGYNTLRVSDNRRGLEVRELQQEVERAKKRNSMMFEKLAEVAGSNAELLKKLVTKDKTITTLAYDLNVSRKIQAGLRSTINKQWWTKVTKLFSTGEKK